MEEKLVSTDLDIPSIKSEIAGFPEIILAYLFGSYARGQANGMSDVDIAILVCFSPHMGAKKNCPTDPNFCLTDGIDILLNSF